MLLLLLLLQVMHIVHEKRVLATDQLVGDVLLLKALLRLCWCDLLRCFRCCLLLLLLELL